MQIIFVLCPSRQTELDEGISFFHKIPQGLSPLLPLLLPHYFPHYFQRQTFIRPFIPPRYQCTHWVVNHVVLCRHFEFGLATSNSARGESTVLVEPSWYLLRLWISIWFNAIIILPLLFRDVSLTTIESNGLCDQIIVTVKVYAICSRDKTDLLLHTTENKTNSGNVESGKRTFALE